MSRIRMVHDAEAPPYIDPAFAADCHGALDALLAKGVVSVTFIGEGCEADTLYLESYPPSFNLQIGAVLRAKVQYLNPMTEPAQDAGE